MLSGDNWHETERLRIEEEKHRVGWLELRHPAEPEDHRGELFTKRRQDAEARLIVAIEQGEQGNYQVAVRRLGTFLADSHGGGSHAQGGYLGVGGNIETIAPALARLAAHHLIRFIVLQAKQVGNRLDDRDAVQAAAAFEYIRKSKDTVDRDRMFKMLEEVGAECWVYKGK